MNIGLLKNIFLYVFLAVTLSGCASGYLPSNPFGGYTEKKLSFNTWFVEFSGNAYTSKQQVTDYVLIRSAEIAIKNDYERFAILDSAEHSSDLSFTTPLMSTTYLNANVQSQDILGNSRVTGNATTFYYGGDSITLSKPNRSVVILLTDEIKGNGSWNAFSICNQIAVKYGIRCRVD